MLFNSIKFAIFIAVIFVCYWKIPHKYRWLFLLIASYYFYASWSLKYLFLIVITTITSYICAILIEKIENKNKRKAILLICLIICFGILFIFKYLNFFFELLASVLSVFTINIHSLTLTLLLPVGISFYTFQTISYVIDVYRKSIKAERHFGYYATFVSFFPQLVAGPIERPNNLLPQIKNEKKFDYYKAMYGVKLMAWGYFKKIVIADNLASYVDSIYNNPYEFKGFVWILATVLFSIQIYCDFSGYTDIAKGCSKLLGIDLMDNFRAPYLSTSLKEFWSKWHISLSTWFKDYLYIPLGGNKCSSFRRNLNLFITFLVSGLWHGANLTFVIWGAFHGLMRIIENLFFKFTYKKKHCFLRWITLMIIVCTSWIFFRSNSIKDAIYIFKNIFIGINHPFNYLLEAFKNINLNFMSSITIVFIYLLPLFMFDYTLGIKEKDPIKMIDDKPKIIKYAIYFLLILIIMLYHYTGEVVFIYFQF